MLYFYAWFHRLQKEYIAFPNGSTTQKYLNEENILLLKDLGYQFKELPQVKMPIDGQIADISFKKYIKQLLCESSHSNSK